MSNSDLEIDLEDMNEYFGPCPTVYLASSLTSPDLTSLRTVLIQKASSAFSQMGFTVYDPHEHTPLCSFHAPEDVYEINHDHSMEADLIFFLRSQPSMGMGIEAQIAADMLVPWGEAKFKQSSYSPTPIFSGLANRGSSLQVLLDKSKPNEFGEQIRRMLRENKVKQTVCVARNTRRKASELIEKAKLGQSIRKQRILLCMSVEILSDHSGVPERLLWRIESDEKFVRSLSPVQLQLIMQALRLEYAGSGLDFPRLKPKDRFDKNIQELAENFTERSLDDRYRSYKTQYDIELMGSWRELLESKRINLPVISITDDYSSVGKITGYISMPVSNVDENTRIELDQFVLKLREAIEQAGLPIVLISPEMFHTNREEHATTIYSQAISAIAKSDFAICVPSPPATGVGVTCKIFANLALPTLLVAHQNEHLSRMVTGAPIPWLGEAILHESIQKSVGLIVQRLKENINNMRAFSSRRRQALPSATSMNVGDALARYRLSRGKTLDDTMAVMSSKALLRPEWFEALLNPSGLAAHATLFQLAQIATLLEGKFAVSSRGQLMIQSTGKFHFETDPTTLSQSQYDAAEVSLSNLIKAKSDIDSQGLFKVEESVVYERWKAYCHELTLHAGRRETNRLVRTVEEWIQVMTNDDSF